MKATKVFALLCAVALLVSLFCGCGGGTAATPAPEAAPEAPAPEAPAPEASEPEAPEAGEEEPVETAYFPLTENKTLSLWMSFPPFFNGVIEGPSDYLYYQEVQERLNITLEFTQVPIPAAAEAFSVMVAADSCSDIMTSFANYFPGSLDDAIDQEVILDLTDLVADYAPDYEAYRVSNDDNARATLTAGGKQAMIYYFYGEEGYVPDLGPVIRGDWLEALGMEQPRTYDDYEEVLTAFNTEYGATFGLPAGGMTRMYYFEAGFDMCLPWTTNNAGFFQIDDQVYWGPATEGFREYLTLMNKWYNAGILSSDFVSDVDSASSSVVAEDRIATEEVGMFFGRSKELAKYNGLVGSEEANFVGAYDPTRNEGDVTHVRKTMVYAYAPSAVAISAKVADPELALRYLNYWFTEEGNMLANYGVEGVTYNIDEGGNITFTEMVTKNPDGLGLDAALAMCTGATTGCPHVFDNMKWELLYSEEQLDAGYKWASGDDGAYVLTQEYKALLTEEEISEFTSIFTDMKTYFDENIIKFITGERDLSEYDDYVAQIEDLGLEEVCTLLTNGWKAYQSR